MDIRTVLGKSFLMFDGGMGTMIQAAGLKPGDPPEIFNILHPDIVCDIHRRYIKAGAMVITTNTFGANEYKLGRIGLKVEEVVKKAVEIGKLSAGGKIVALDIGPIGIVMEPAGELSFERAYDMFKRQVRAGADAGADLILIETMSDLYEARAAVLAAKENSSLPVFCTMTFQQNGRTLMGTDPLTMVNVLEGLGVDALGANCSLGPREIMPIVSEILGYASVPVIVQPNAGLPGIEGKDTVYGVSPFEFAGYIKDMAGMGASVFGGCCGTNPDYIDEAIRALSGMYPVRIKNNPVTMVSSAGRTVMLDGDVRVVGERINPTGKKRLKEALKNRDMSYIAKEAVSQKQAGADILDINIGLPDIDEKEMMVMAVREVQRVVDLPLQIDSSNPDVIEAAARVCSGKPVINSVNGRQDVMDSIFPIVKKYGACVVGLTMDENGIPPSAEARAQIAGRIISRAQSCGIPKENVIIDCLVLTASAQQQEVMEAVKAVRMVKDAYGVKTTLGISNVSFGLPNREALNRTYLAMALSHGLDAPIINPMDEGMMETVDAFRVLSNMDGEARSYVYKYGNRDTPALKEQSGESRDLMHSIMDGLSEEAIISAKELLKVEKPMDIVDSYIIPALDAVGKSYEKGDIFLPQLMLCAETVKGVFAVIKEAMLKNGEGSISKGRVLLATVKGDIHDIGKNIVKVLLENYGFEVVDLGKDVPAERIVGEAMAKDIKLVGLSALMTTTLKSMEETIKAIKHDIPGCSIMVGGAVLNSEYAKIIGADYYGADAREAVGIVRSVFKLG